MTETCEVQPVYLKGHIDGDTARKSADAEIVTMTRITDAIRDRFPEVSTRLLPVIVVEEVVVSGEVAEAMVTLFEKRLAVRRVCQLGSLCEFSRTLGMPCEMGVDHWTGGADTWLQWQDKAKPYPTPYICSNRHVPKWQDEDKHQPLILTDMCL